ncbi:MAG: PfkB family carbohydrate kinase [Rhodoferax sp.]|nr:PfkB family carbohydrate kinase [Rhodoferax sp.]MDP3654480.1 PfkB family carbohydrate kinase [Rhodoferax sp.]
MSASATIVNTAPTVAHAQNLAKNPPYIAVIGGANMDIGAQTPVPLVTGDSTPGHIRCAPGGVARNVAENLARLGHQACLLSAVGDDVFGKCLLDASTKAGVDTGAVCCLPSQRTASYLSLHGPDGDMAGAVNDMDILDCLSPTFLAPYAAMLQSAACTVLDCNLSPDTLAWLLADTWTQPIFVDAVSMAKCGRIAPWLPRIHLLKVNRLEAEVLCGRAVVSIEDARLSATHLHQRGVRHVVVSLGEQGVCWCDADGSVGWQPVRPVKVVNTSGAGDALLAGLVHAHLNRMPLPVAVDFAMACAELTLSSTFANAPELSVAMVQRHLSARASFL